MNCGAFGDALSGPCRCRGVEHVVSSGAEPGYSEIAFERDPSVIEEPLALMGTGPRLLGER